MRKQAFSAVILLWMINYTARRTKTLSRSYFVAKLGFIETLGQKENGKEIKSSSVSVWFSVLHTALYISFRCFKIEKYVVSFSLSLNFFNLFKWHIDCALNNAVNLGAKIQHRFA